MLCRRGVIVKGLIGDRESSLHLISLFLFYNHCHFIFSLITLEVIMKWPARVKLHKNVLISICMRSLVGTVDLFSTIIVYKVRCCQIQCLSPRGRVAVLVSLLSQSLPELLTLQELFLLKQPPCIRLLAHLFLDKLLLVLLLSPLIENCKLQCIFKLLFLNLPLTFLLHCQDFRI